MTVSGVDVADITQIISEVGVSVSYYAATNITATMTGDNVVSYASPATKSWIFFKRGSKIELMKYGIVDQGDAYLIMPTTDSLSYADRIIYSGETFEFTPECISALREIDGTQLFKYFTLKKVA